MSMTLEEKIKMAKEHGRPDLAEVLEINASGYAGILPNGNIVDRRKHPKAIPVQENSLFGIPKPKPINHDH